MRHSIRFHLFCLTIGLASLSLMQIGAWGQESPGVGLVHSYDYPDRIAVGMAREQKVSLDGDWQFQRDPENKGETGEWFKPGKITERKALVPLPWELVNEDLREYNGFAWYSREFKVPGEWKGKRITFVTHGIAEVAKIWVNGELAGDHTGSQTPFALDITPLVRFDAPNVITVRVFNPRTGVSYYLDTHSLLNVSGMWRSVWLEATAADVFIADVFMVPDVDKSLVTAKVTLCSPGKTQSSKQKIAISLKGTGGKIIEQTKEVAVASSQTASPQFTEIQIPIKLKDAKLWSPDSPNLYSVEAKIVGTDEKVGTRFGMRKIEKRKGRFYLNNKPIYIFGGGIDPLPYGGAGDVNWFMPGPYRYPTPAENNADAKLIKSLNINYLREGLRPFQPDFLRAASEVGLLAVEENSWRTNIATEKELLDTWSAIVLRDRNNPSVMLWTMFNEGWGYRLDWANALYDHLYKLDPTRLVCENTGGVSHYRNYPGNHKKSDIEDIHQYPGFNLFPRDYWMKHTSVKAPLLAGEFGPIPYFFNPDAYRRAWNNGDANGKDPWWFSAYPHSENVPNPDWRKDWNHHGIDGRFTGWGLDKVYGNWDKCVDAHDWYYYWGLKDQTQAMRMNPEMAGFVVWIWDNAQHGTGLITNFKTKKVFADELAKIWTPDLVVIDERRHNYWARDRVQATLHVSHFSQINLKGARVDYWVQGTKSKGSIPCFDIEPGQSRIVGDIQLQLGDVDKVAMHKLMARLVSADGKTISENYEPIYIYPHADCIPSPITYASHLIPGHVWGALNTFGSPGNYGYKQPGLIHDVPTAPLIVTGTLDAKAEEELVNGSTVILVASEDQPLLKANGITLGSANLGGHCNSFYTKRGLGIFDRVPCENPITWAYYRLWPKKVLEGVKPEQHEDILAGGYMNLMNHHVATMAQFKVGKGVLIVTTLDLFEAVVEDPAAVLVFNDLLDYANRGPKPKAELKATAEAK